MEPETGQLILVIVVNSEVSDLICRQTLNTMGYRTEVAADISQAVAKTESLSPDCIIAGLNLPGGLTARDLLIMLQSQGLDVPVIVLANKGSEMDIIQAFRLGAEDYLLWPVRETEILAVVERVLKRVNSRRQRERMEAQIKEANDELRQRVRELTTIYSIGKAVTSVTDLGTLCEKILDGALHVTEASLGWLLLRDDATKVFFLVAQRNLPEAYAAHWHKPWNDGISSLAARSGKVVSLHGADLSRFQVSQLGQSILVVPIKTQDQVIGLLVAMLTESVPYGASAIHLVEAVADFASISLVNARLFLATEERLRAYQRAEAARPGEKMSLEMLQNFNKEQNVMIEETVDTLERLAKIPASHWSKKQREALIKLRDQVEGLIHLAEATANISDQ